MKARLEQGEVKIYSTIPKAFLTVSGFLPIFNGLQSVEGQVIPDADTLSEDTLRSFGFFDYVRPQYDSRIQELGDIYFNDEIFTQDVQDRDLVLTLEEYKQNVINNYDYTLHREFSKTDYHYIKQLELGTEIPQDVLNVRTALRAEAEVVKSEINALTTKKDVLTYDLPNYKF